MATGFAYSVEFLRHVTAPGHPERVARLTAILSKMQEGGFLDHLTAIAPRPVTEDDLLAVHDKAYLRRLEEACLRGDETIDCADSSICHDSMEVAKLAAGAGTAAVDAVMAGTVENAFCAVRPPGHHAERDRSMGFCLFNNVAVAARHLQRRHGIGKVLILDWDVHHGNGTQHIFEDDPSVFFCSFHQDPRSQYPGTGFGSETGRGAGAGTTLNVPFAPGAGDDDVIRAFEERFLPAARAFAPEFVLVSAGYDAHGRDPLGGLDLTERGFDHLAAGIKRFARDTCRGRLVALLEGGYDLTALATNVRRTVEIFAAD